MNFLRPKISVDQFGNLAASVYGDWQVFPDCNKTKSEAKEIVNYSKWPMAIMDVSCCGAAIYLLL